MYCGCYKTRTSWPRHGTAQSCTTHAKEKIQTRRCLAAQWHLVNLRDLHK